MKKVAKEIKIPAAGVNSTGMLNESKSLLGFLSPAFVFKMKQV
jgi:hypothetical protein